MNENTSTAPNGIVQHAQLEMETLGHIKSALAGAVAAEFAAEDRARKLANVRFVVGSFQRYVERVFALEEHDGYMPALAESHPHLQHQIDELRAEHHKIRERIRKIVVRLESLSVADASDFEEVCGDIVTLISKIDAHTHTETCLLQDAYNMDVGGES